MTDDDTDIKEERKNSLDNRFNSGGGGQRTSQTDNNDKTSDEDKTDKTENIEQTQNTNQADKTAKTGREAKTSGGDDERPSTKDKRAMTMYLHPQLITDLDIRFQEVNIKHQRECGETLQKNADFYPALLRAGMKHVEDELDIEE